jgi:hypothetical protein
VRVVSCDALYLAGAVDGVEVVVAVRGPLVRAGAPVEHGGDHRRRAAGHGQQEREAAAVVPGRHLAQKELDRLQASPFARLHQCCVRVRTTHTRHAHEALRNVSVASHREG